VRKERGVNEAKAGGKVRQGAKQLMGGRVGAAMFVVEQEKSG